MAEADKRHASELKAKPLEELLRVTMLCEGNKVRLKAGTQGFSGNFTPATIRACAMTARLRSRPNRKSTIADLKLFNRGTFYDSILSLILVIVFLLPLIDSWFTILL